MIEIRLLSLGDIDAYGMHLERLLPESGRDGRPHFCPYESGEYRFTDEIRSSRLGRWSLDISMPNAERTFGLWQDGRICGHVDIRRLKTRSMAHRGLLGMGIESHLQGAGHGRAIMSYGLDWFTKYTDVDWIDLYVFSENIRARKLYESLGFDVVGVTKDLVRLGDMAIDDVHMCLRLPRC